MEVKNDDDDANARGQNVECSFVTRMGAAWEVPTAPMSLPASLGRYGLSEVVNMMLSGRGGFVSGSGEEEKEATGMKPRPFEFLAGGEMIRGSLASFLARKKISTEEVLELEYIPAVLPPSPRHECPLEDWVRCVDAAVQRGQHHHQQQQDRSKELRILSGGYDGCARLWDLSGTMLCECRGHTAGVTGVSIFSETTSAAIAKFAADNDDDNVMHAVTASNDGSCLLWRIPTCCHASHSDADENAEQPKAVHSALMVGQHESAIECVAAANDTAEKGSTVLVATGGWDAALRIWALQENDGSGDDNEPSEKRAKLSHISTKQQSNGASHADVARLRSKEEMTIDDHTQCVASVAWRLRSRELVSGSWDHSVRLWDIEHGGGKAIDTVHTGRAVYCVAVQRGPHNGADDDLVAFAGASQAVRLWDTRCTGGTAVSLRPLGNHAGWVSSLSWSHTSEYHLLSTSHDGCFRIWDIRSSPEALHSVAAHEGKKALCGTWLGSFAIATGGEDCKLRICDIDLAGCF